MRESRYEVCRSPRMIQSHGRMADGQGIGIIEPEWILVSWSIVMEMACESVGEFGGASRDLAGQVIDTERNGSRSLGRHYCDVLHRRHMRLIS
jgi:hypothetical protein